MTREEFDKLFNKRVEELIATGKTKGVKYTGGSEDRLVNFKALEPRVSRFVVWEVFFRKHLSSILHYLKTGENIGEDICDTHIHDCIMYLHLLEGLIKEQKIEKPNSVCFWSEHAQCSECRYISISIDLLDLSVPHFCPNCDKTTIHTKV